MVADGRNVYLVKIGSKFLREGSQGICKDKECNWHQLLPTKTEISQTLAVFSFCVQNEIFTSVPALSKRLFDVLKKVLCLASAMECADGDK